MELVSKMPISLKLDILLPMQFHRSTNRAGQIISAYTVDMEKYNSLADGGVPVMPAYISSDVVEPDLVKYVKTTVYPESLAGKKVKTPVIGDDLYLSGTVGWIDQDDNPTYEKIRVRQ
jgi:hypothetical protein